MTLQRLFYKGMNAFTQGAFTYERFYTDLLLRD